MIINRENFNTRVCAARQGFSLVEILVALIILSIGLLGLAALQTTSLRVGHDSYLRTQATMLAYDMADRMRVNPAGLSAGKYDSVAYNSNPGTTNCVTSSCTSDELADYDIRSWHSVVAAKLVGGKGTIATATTSGVTLRTITLTWSEDDLSMELKIVVQL